MSTLESEIRYAREALNTATRLLHRAEIIQRAAQENLDNLLARQTKEPQ